MSSQNKRKIGGIDDEYTDVTNTPKRVKTAKSGPSKRRVEAFEEETEEERNARLAKKKGQREEIVLTLYFTVLLSRLLLNGCCLLSGPGVWH